jgi:hypothetical protein
MKDNEELEEWVARALADDVPEDEYGRFANDMLSVCGRAPSLDPLRALFSVDRPLHLGLASFLTVELYRKARPLLPEVVEAVSQTRPGRGRNDLYETIANCATHEDGWAVACLFDGLRDPERAVRRKVMQILTYLDSAALRAGLKYLNPTHPGWKARGWGGAFEGAKRGNTTHLKKLLASSDEVDRLFAVAMCMRPRLAVDQKLADLANAIEDPEIEVFVAGQTDWPTPIYAIGPIPLPEHISKFDRRSRKS